VTGMESYFEGGDNRGVSALITCGAI